MASTVTFTESAVKRIRSAVRRVEGMAQDNGGQTVGTYDTQTEFWAILLGSDVSGRYSFQPVRPNPGTLIGDGVIIINDRGDELKWVFTESPAFDAAGREANGNVSVPPFMVVRMTFAGYDAAGEPVFVFFWPPQDYQGGLPPHDHRDNLNGGFAFGVMHPGTGIPQMPYAL